LLGGAPAAPAAAVAATATAGTLFAVRADAVAFLAQLAAAAARGGGGAAAGVAAQPAEFDAVLFARFLHRGALGASALALRARGGLVCAETFRAADGAALPRESLLEGGELRACVAAGLAGSARSGWAVRTLHEGAAATEDGRELWSAVVWAGPG
jgi:hypothetical protein